MSKYFVEIEEVLQKVIEVEAESEEVAEFFIRKEYGNDLVELTANDLKETNFKVLKGFENENNSNK